MKSLLIIFFLFCCAGAAFTQHVPSSCDAPDSVKRMYREDAAWLTYRYEIGNDSHYADSVTILQNVQNIFLEGLLAVRNAVSLPAVDTLTHFSFVRDFEKPHPFRSFHPYFLRQIELFIDTTIPWEKNLAHAKIPTGNGSFDSLIEIFGITFDSVYKYYSDFWVGVTHIPYNVLVLDSLINRIATPQLLADQYGFVGDGDRIEGRIEGKDTMILTYSVGWGDCPNGCISRRYWRFTVYPDCSVQYDSSYGD